LAQLQKRLAIYRRVNMQQGSAAMLMPLENGSTSISLSAFPWPLLFQKGLTQLPNNITEQAAATLQAISSPKNYSV
jgi:hypothetical protein